MSFISDDEQHHFCQRGGVTRFGSFIMSITRVVLRVVVVIVVP